MLSSINNTSAAQWESFIGSYVKAVLFFLWVGLHDQDEGEKRETICFLFSINLTSYFQGVLFLQSDTVSLKEDLVKVLYLNHVYMDTHAEVDYNHLVVMLPVLAVFNPIIF